VKRTGVCVTAAALSLGCYTYVPATMDVVPVGARVRALLSSEAEVALHDSLGLDLRALSGTLVERQDTRLLFQVRTASGSPAFGSQPLYQRIAVSPQDVLRVDVRRLNGVRTGVLVTAIAGAALIAAIEGFGWLRPGTPAQPPGGPPEQRRPW